MATTIRHADEEESEGYFASVSDLMVGILFIFLLMLTVFALNFHDAADQQQVALKKYEEKAAEADQAKREAEHERELARHAEEAARLAEAKAAEQLLVNQRLRDLLNRAVAQLEHDIEDRQNVRTRLLTSLEQSLRDRNIRVTLDSRSGILRLSGDLLFETGQFVLKPEARQTVSVLAEVMSRILGCYAEGAPRDGCDADSRPILESVLVEGHTDRQPYRNATGTVSSQDLNDRLSTDRALTVFKELRQFQAGLDALRNGEQQPLLAFSGYGQRRPLADAMGATEADYQRNRRIDLRFVLSSRTSDEVNRLRQQINEVLEQR